MISILARRSGAEISTARLNEPGMLSKRAKKVPLSIHRTLIGQISMISLPYQVSDLISLDIGTVDKAFNWLIRNLGTVM